MMKCWGLLFLGRKFFFGSRGKPLSHFSQPRGRGPWGLFACPGGGPGHDAPDGIDPRRARGRGRFWGRFCGNTPPNTEDWAFFWIALPRRFFFLGFFGALRESKFPGWFPIASRFRGELTPIMGRKIRPPVNRGGGGDRPIVERIPFCPGRPPPSPRHPFSSLSGGRGPREVFWVWTGPPQTAWGTPAHFPFLGALFPLAALFPFNPPSHLLRGFPSMVCEVLWAKRFFKRNRSQKIKTPKKKGNFFFGIFFFSPLHS